MFHVGRFWTQQYRGYKNHLALTIITDQSIDDASFPPKPAEQLTNEFVSSPSASL